MAGTNKIFKQLQDFEVTPPPGIFAKLWGKIKRIGQETKTLPEVKLHANRNETENNKETAGDTFFNELKSYTSTDLQPPPFDFKKIKEAASQKTEVQQMPPVKNITAAFPVLKILVAASITGIVFFMYTLLFPGKKSDTPKNNIHTAAGKNDVPGLTTMPHSGDNATHQSGKNMTANSTQPKFKLIYANGYISKNGNSTLLENDFLYTFTHYTYDQANTLLARLKKDKLVSLNSYSYLNISDKMAAYLKGMYEVNDREKPTRKAKKLKAKLAKWKKKDESYFDRNMQKNPLDILDLGEFILK